MKGAKQSGGWGEAITAEYLRNRGYKIIAMNARSRFGEIDIIAQNESYICFVEVKLRRDADFAEAREFVGFDKMRRIKMTADYWMLGNPSQLQPRFDVVEIYAPYGVFTANPTINIIENAFS